MAISKKPKFAVVLTKEAIGLLKDENIYLNLVKGKCFICEEIEASGNYFYMKLSDGSAPPILAPHMWEISVPHHYILYVLSAVTDKMIALI
jgi:hypothetical protein